METYQALIATLALTMGVGWASGINLYAAVFVLGLAGATGNVALPEGLQVVQDPLVIAAAGIMYVVEFFVDKTPGADTGWDSLHTFIRIPAGAMLAAGAVLLRLNGLLPEVAWRNPVVRGLTIAGLALFATIAALTAWLGDGWLNYPPGTDNALMMLIEIIATLSIATVLTLLVAGNKTELEP